LFFFYQFRFELVHRTGTSCTAVAFNLRNPSEFLLGMPDFTVKCFDAGKISMNIYKLIEFCLF